MPDHPITCPKPAVQVALTSEKAVADSAAESAEDDMHLPTRQMNALRHLLDRAQVTPEEVARLGYGVLERAPGVGRQSIEVIRAWLRKHGLDLQGRARETHRLRDVQRQRKLEQAIRLLQKYGYDIRPPKQPSDGV